MALTESELTVSVPSVYTQEQIASRFLPDINGLLEKQIGTSCRLKIIAAQPDGKRQPESSASPTSAAAPDDDDDAPSTDTTLNPEYTFDRFVVGTGQSFESCSITCCVGKSREDL